jgi:serine/threonine protein kinase
VIFWIDSTQSKDPILDILEKQVSHFAEWNDLEAFLQYLGRKHPARDSFRRIADSFGENNPRRPFSLWKSDLLDSDFKDLIRKMTNFDPRQRITAAEALDHPWFQEVTEA